MSTRSPSRSALPLAVVVLSCAALIFGPRVAEGLGRIAPAAPVQAPQATDCRVTQVIDGDTVAMVCPGTRFRARLTGFDTPELFSPQCPEEHAAAMRARRHLGTLLRPETRLDVVWRGQDRYGRMLVALTADGQEVAPAMIAAGLARAYDGGRRGGWCTGAQGV